MTIQKEFFSAPRHLLSIMGVKLFLEQMVINAALVWFTVSTRIELKCFVFVFN